MWMKMLADLLYSFFLFLVTILRHDLGPPIQVHTWDKVLQRGDPFLTEGFSL